MKKQIFFLFLLGAFPIIAQVTFTEAALELGIDHHYKNSTTMGGGAAFFDYDNDGWEDLYINGGSNSDALYKNLGNGTFEEVTFEAGILSTMNYVPNSVITGDIDNDGFRDIFLTTEEIFPNHLLLNRGDGTFVDITQFAGLSDYLARSNSASFGDFNQDGFLDIYVGNYIDVNQFFYNAMGDVIGFDHICYDDWLFINNGDLTFWEASSEWGLSNLGCVLASTVTDFDKDGDLDLLIANDFGGWVVPNRLFENQHPEIGFVEVSENTMMDAGIYAMGIASADYDHDLDLDLDYYITNIGRNGFYENQNNQGFLDLAQMANVEDIYADTSFTSGWGTVFMDADNDSWDDLFVANGHISSAAFIDNNQQNPNRFFQNNGNGTFSDFSTAAGFENELKGRGCAYSDFDRDGDLDLVVVNANDVATGDPIEPILFYKNENGNDQNWLQVRLIGTTSNRDAFGSQIKIVLSDRSWLHEIKGGSSHASQNSSAAHFGLGAATMVDSLEITWPSGLKEYFANINANQFLTYTEGGSTTHSNENIANNLFEIKISPNPIFHISIVTINNPQQLNASFKLINTLGKIIKYWGNIENNKFEINADMVLPGIYFLNAFDKKGDFISSEKIIVE